VVCPVQDRFVWGGSYEPSSLIWRSRSDLPNQINNVRAFPGVFRGLLTKQVRLHQSVLAAAADAIAGLVDEPGPDVFDDGLVDRFAAAVVECGRPASAGPA
jgi:malate dehydrogenase (oxaloacetate-decarboxylating)